LLHGETVAARGAGALAEQGVHGGVFLARARRDVLRARRSCALAFRALGLELGAAK